MEILKLNVQYTAKPIDVVESRCILKCVYNYTVPIRDKYHYMQIIALKRYT